MSTIKVNKIENTSTTDGGVSIDNDGHVTIDGQQLPTAGPLSNRNLIINGAMQVAQRGTSTTNVDTPGYYSVDRMRHSTSNLAALRTTISQATDSPSGFGFSHRVEVTTAGAENTSAGLRVQYGIEGQDLQHLDWGTANAKPLSVSFWVKASAAGNYALILYRAEGTARNIGTVFEITANEVDNWKQITHTFPGDQTTAITNDNSGRLYFYISMGEGSDFTTTDNTTWDTYADGRWAYGQTAKLYTTVGAYLQVTGIQLEVGSKSTPFEHRSYSDELQRCMRYFQMIGTGCMVTRSATGVAYGNARLEGSIVIPRMRSAPTTASNAGGSTITTGMLDVSYGNQNNVELNFVVTSGSSSHTITPNYNDVNNGNTSLGTAFLFGATLEDIHISAEL